MDYNKFIDTKFADPAAVLSYKDGIVRLLDLNEKFISEHWANTTKDIFISSYTPKSFDEENLRRFTVAVKKCIETGEEQEVETWRQMISDCCGFNKVCLNFVIPWGRG